MIPVIQQLEALSFTCASKYWRSRRPISWRTNQTGFMNRNPKSFAARVNKGIRQNFLNSENWSNQRLDVLAHQSRPNGLHCYTCGRPMETHQANVHHMRYPHDVDRIVSARDLIGICGKCHGIVRQFPEMQDPALSKRGLKRLVTCFLENGGAKRKNLGLMITF